MSTNVQVGKSSGNGLGLASVLTIIFVVLKVLNVQPVASWSWIWVLSPLWISFLLGVAVLVLFGLGFLVYLGITTFRNSPAQRRRAFKKRQVLAERARLRRELEFKRRQEQNTSYEAALRGEYGIDKR